MEPNQVGELVLVTIGLILTCFEFASLKERIVLGSIAIMTLSLTVMADSRSDLVALAIGSIFYVCWRYRLKGVVAIGVMSVVAALGLTVMGSDLAHYIWRGDVWTLTGRTDVWHFTMREIAAKPLTGYGYQTGGAIFASRYFPLWWGPWDEGPRSSIHNGYLSSMAGIGIPGTIFWLFIVLRPWIGIFREPEDPWRLKRLLFFVVIPMLVMNIDESMIDDCAGASGFLFTVVWAVAEQHRLTAIRRAAMTRTGGLLSLPPAVVALLSQ
jgi:O-antigen ligase